MFQDTRPAELGADGGPDAGADFRVTDSCERLRLLKKLRDGSVPVMLSAPQGITLAGQLWAMEPAGRQISFISDAGSAPLLRLAQNDKVVAVAYLDSVKLQFDLVDLLLVHSADACALRARLPDVLYRFQRRAAFRVRTLQRPAPQALLRHPSMPDMRLGLRIVDLSVSGCALLLPRDVPVLQPGTTLSGVRIEIDVDTGFDTTLRLQHVIAMHGDGHVLRLGCEFIGLDGPAQRALQRSIDQTQQRRRLMALG